MFLESGNDVSGEVGDLRVGESSLTALESDAHQERVFSGGHIFATKEICCFDGCDFADVERANRTLNLGEAGSVWKKKGKIALDGREARQRLVPARIFEVTNGGVEWIKLEFRNENILTQLEAFGDATSELACDTD